MAKIDDFKLFVKDNPVLISYVKNNEMTWQKFYEIYDLYGTDHNVWNQYLKEKSKVKEETENKNMGFKDILNMAKNIDVNKVQNGISSMQKALGLFGDLVLKKDTTSSETSYQPRPLYKTFED